MSDAPHHQAAFINAIHEEGTKAEAVKYLQETWNELCEARARIRELEAALERIAHMKPHHAGQTANEYHMQQIAKDALAGQGGE